MLCVFSAFMITIVVGLVPILTSSTLESPATVYAKMSFMSISVPINPNSAVKYHPTTQVHGKENHHHRPAAGEKQGHQVQHR
jgi:hypothetical protein